MSIIFFRYFLEISYICSIVLIIIKELSSFAVIESIMNLHEECLLKYLLNPLDLLQSTELLKFNNSLIEKSICVDKILAKKAKINYTRI